MEFIILIILITQYKEKQTDPKPTKTRDGIKRLIFAIESSNKNNNRNKHVKKRNKGMNGIILA